MTPENPSDGISLIIEDLKKDKKDFELKALEAVITRELILTKMLIALTYNLTVTTIKNSLLKVIILSLSGILMYTLAKEPSSISVYTYIALWLLFALFVKVSNVASWLGGEKKK